MLKRFVTPLSALVLGGAAALAATGLSPAPTLGPGAVVAMHRQLFRAIDAGDVETALAFLSDDLNMDAEYRRRPCTLFLNDRDGKPIESVGVDASRALLARWVEESKEGEWKTEIRVGTDDCFSGELSYAVLDFQRQRIDSKERSIERFRSTSLVTYDGGWKITHWHVSPAPEPGTEPGTEKEASAPARKR